MENLKEYSKRFCRILFDYTEDPHDYEFADRPSRIEKEKYFLN